MQSYKILPDDHIHITIHYNGFDHLREVCRLNELIFGEKRLLNRLDHDPMIFLTAHIKGELAGFKIGYALSRHLFYSAKGATSPHYRKRGVATRLLQAMLSEADRMGFSRLEYDNFPATYPGMTILGLKNGFRIKRLHWNPEQEDFQIRLFRDIRSGNASPYPGHT